MAEIPVEQKKGGTAMWWILGLIVAALLVWLLTRGDDTTEETSQLDTSGNTSAVAPGVGTPTGASYGEDRDTLSARAGAVAGETSGTSMNDAATPGGATGAAGASVADVDAITGSADRTDFVGRSANLSEATVVRVISDRAFTVGSDRSKELFVMLDDKLDAGAAESRVRIEAGERLTLVGNLEAPPSPETMAERYRGLSAAETSELRAQDVYLHAVSVQGMQ